MNVTEKDRLDLRQKLDEVLGDRLAEIAMEAMPQLDYDNLATKQDVTNLGIELRADMATTHADLRTDMATMHTNLRGEISDLRDDMGKQFRQFFFANLAAMITMLGFVIGLT